MRYITNANHEDIRLAKRDGVFQYEDGRGLVRLSIIVPATFATEQDARTAAAMLVMSVDADGNLIP